MRHATTASRIVDILVEHPGSSYSGIIRLMGHSGRWKAGVALNELLGDGIVYRSSDGRYTLSKDSQKALAA